MTRKTQRFFTRLAILIPAILVATRLLPRAGRGLSILFMSLSPFLSVSAAVAARNIGWALLPGLLIALVAVFRGRWFCRNLCPTGLLAESTGRLRKKSARAVGLPRIGQWLVLLTIGAACFGIPLFLWLDPLAILNGGVAGVQLLIQALQGLDQPDPGPFSLTPLPMPPAAACTGVGIVLIVLLSVWRRNAWCHHLCPLGATQDLLHRLRPPQRATTFSTRRSFLAAAAGGTIAITARALCNPRPLIRPPGVFDEQQLTALCARCGNCANACPQGIIRPDLGTSGVAGFLTPAITIGPRNYCAADCVECSRACPTNAINCASLEDKQCVTIGTARVDRHLCRPWNGDTFCRVCVDHCPYRAITMTQSRHLLPAPVVDPNRCRGCGLCQTVCPALEVAITVTPHPQRRLTPVEIHLQNTV